MMRPSSLPEPSDRCATRIVVRYLLLDWRWRPVGDRVTALVAGHRSVANPHRARGRLRSRILVVARRCIWSSASIGNIADAV